MTAEATATEIINAARAYADDIFNLATPLLDEAVVAAQGYVTLDAVSIPEFSVIDVPAELNVEEIPDFSAVFSFTGTLPTLGTLQPVVVPEVDFDALQKPEDVDLEQFFDFDRPTSFEGTVPGEPAGISDPIATPSVPTIVQPDAPVLDDITRPDKPTLSVPVFDQAQPPAPPALDVDVGEEFESQFNNVLPVFRDYWKNEVDQWIERYCPDLPANFAALKAKLNDYLAGGTALPEEVEQAIYDRARGRADPEFTQGVARATNEAARRGFTLPQGFQIEEVRRLNEALARSNANVAIEIAIKQAELEQQNIQFAINASSTLYTTILNAGLSYGTQVLEINNQALAYARTFVEQIIQAYNQTVRLYELQLSTYRVEADLFRTRLEASLAQIRIYEAEVRLEALTAELNQQEVRTYTARIEAEAQKINLYRAQLAGIATEIDRRNALVNLFRGQLEGFRAQLSIKEFDVRIYEALTRGDTAKLQGLLSRYDVYRTEVQAETAKAELATQAASLTNTANRNIVDVFEGELRAYLGELDASKSVFDGEVREYLGRLEAFKAELDARIKSLTLQVDQNKVTTDVNIQASAQNTQRAVANAQLFLKSIENHSNMAFKVGDLYAQTAKAAISAQNTLTNLGNTTTQSS